MMLLVPHFVFLRVILAIHGLGSTETLMKLAVNFKKTDREKYVDFTHSTQFF